MTSLNRQGQRNITISDRIEKAIVRIPESGCWIWEKSLTNLGYARIFYKGKSRHAHRVSFENYVGDIPDGLELDHLCNVRCCVNPNHLNPVTRYENMKRSSAWSYRKNRTHCPNGHELTDDNKYTAKCLGNKYLCLKCKIQRDKKYSRKGE